MTLFLVALTFAKAQTSIKVQAPNVVAADEQFNVTFIIEGENALQISNGAREVISSWCGGLREGRPPVSPS